MNSSHLSEQAVLSVNQLNVLAKDILESSFPNVLVEGEISNLSQPSSGHVYFTLKDDKAQVRAALFAGQKSRLKFKLDNGQKVLVKGALSIFGSRGDYQLIAKVIEQSGEGALRREFDALKYKLEAKGWFEASRKKALPTFCQHLAVITSPNGAAIRDVLHVLERRFPLMGVTIIPSLVQGKEACAQLCSALKTANRLKKSGKASFNFDLILLTRGGGSLEDLWPFNEEALAEAIIDSELPIMSGVGHETDFTICDWVSDYRAPTPSAAAETLSQDQDNLHYWLQDSLTSLKQLMLNTLHSERQKLHYLNKRNINPKQKLLEQSQRLDFFEQRLYKELAIHLQNAKQSLQTQETKLHSQHPKNTLSLLNTQNNYLHKRLFTTFTQQQQQKKLALKHLAKQLNNLSPLNTLDRGYSITRTQQKDALKLVNRYALKHLNIGDTLSTELSGGIIESTISRIHTK